MLAPDSFTISVDKLLERTVDTDMNVMSISPHVFPDLDFADDVALLAELPELLVPALETMASKAASLGLEMNCQKTKVQALDSNHSLGEEVAMVEDCVYLGSLVRSTTQSSPDISCHNAITRITVLNQDNQNWKSKSTISMSTKLKLFTCILPIFLYGSWAATKRD